MSHPTRAIPMWFAHSTMFFAMAWISAALGCSTKSTLDTTETVNKSGAEENTVAPGNPWAEGEDCSNWGCLEARQQIVAPPSDAVACSSPADCANGFCVDGVCCDNACTGTCEACSAAKKGGGVDGTCGTIALYLDPDNECPNAACDGNGVCKSYNGVSCGAGTQ